MASVNDYEMDRIQNAWTENDVSTANAAVTVTRTAATGKHHCVVKVDASFSDVLGTGLLTIKFGTVTKARKYVHGSGAIDFSEFGYENPVVSELVSATLAAGGSTYIGCVTMTGYSTAVKAGD